MHIKRLEIQGFKSFKDRTVVHFDHTITGIVGPNGCGKSNIVDAFFWVMGEQSYKHMRGSNSSDLIFNGSAKYAPMSMAEATLVFEVMDASASLEALTDAMKPKEISVTRRVYRDGASEYFINHLPARLKDVHEIFMDTGVGTKGYSVIEQGQIGKIVNAKPEERRLLIEEAAGIAKYKLRKKESLKKMEQASTNLARLEDLIKEVEKNRNTLEKQAQKAKLYQEYRAELLEKEMALGASRYLKLQTLLSDLDQQQVNLAEVIETHTNSIHTVESTLETKKIEQLHLQKAMESLQSDISHVGKTWSQQQTELQLSRQRREDLLEQSSHMQQEHETVQTTLMELEETLERDQMLMDGLQASTQGSFDAMNKTHSLLETHKASQAAMKKQLVDAENAFFAWQDTWVGLTTQLATTQQQESLLLYQQEQQKISLEKAYEEEAVAKEQLEELQTQALNLAQKKTDVLDMHKTLQVSLLEAQDKLQNLEKEQKHLFARDITCRSQIDSLKVLLDSFEGFSDGSKAVLQWAKEQAVECALFVDHFDVKPEALKAFQSVLSHYMELLIVDAKQGVTTLEQAWQALSQKNSAKVTFYMAHEKALVKTISHRDAVVQACKAVGLGFQGPLSEVVSTKDETLQKFLDPIFCVDSLEPLWQKFHQLSASVRETLQSIVLVTPDGLVSDRLTFFQWGCQSDYSGLWQRKEQMLKLEKERRDLETALSTIQQAITQQQELVMMLQSEHQEHQQALTALQFEQTQLQKDLQHYERLASQAYDRIQQAQVHLDQTLAELEKLQQQVLTKKEDAEALSQEKEKILDHIHASKDGLEAITEVLQTVETQTQALVLEQRVTQDKIAQLSIALQRTQKQQQHYQTRHEELQAFFHKIQSDTDQSGDQEQALQASLQKLSERLQGLKEAYQDAKNTAETLSADIEQSYHRVRSAIQEREEQKERASSVALQREKCQSDIGHLLQNLVEKYGEEAQARLQRDVLETLDEEVFQSFSETVSTLKERIRRLGEVNLMAIEEYEVIAARHTQLTQESQDLKQSLEHLQNAITHINKTSQERFQTAFDAIADRFSKLFPIIFGGGQAHLRLMKKTSESANPSATEDSGDLGLDAGIDIIAQPPGKKVSNITLLSGGEKALTAVCLIFAIFMVKPSPFCVLDEVDAPLDDANIGRFNALLKEMSVKSQFILITHNKKTMELNDTLYGVTMEEPGVSKMVSIQLH